MDHGYIYQKGWRYINMKKIVLLFSLLLSIFFICSCQENPAEQENQELLTAIDEYYNAEINKDWDKTYSLRPDSYKNNVSLETYRLIMTRDSENWQFISYKIDSIDINGDIVDVLITFKEKHLNTTYRTQDDTKWIYIDDMWYALDAATRGHLTFNTSL